MKHVNGQPDRRSPRVASTVSLELLMDEGLPLNRKERFYTGTVFPMIVCRDNFRNFDRFCALIKGCPKLEINGRPETANIQFFTEYSFVESVFGLSRERFPDGPTSKDTPDIVALVSGAERVLLVVEAKMFHATTPTDLLAQMRAQERIIAYIRDTLKVDTVVHCALVPEYLKSNLGAFPYRVVTWRQLYDAFHEIAPDDYFLAVLRYALDHPELVGVAQERGKNSQARLRGIEIYRRFKDGDRQFTMMGRLGGRSGEHLVQDTTSGGWRQQEYEVNSHPSPPNRNWFAIEVNRPG